MNSSLKKDLSTLTTINESTLSKMTNKIIWCITDAVCKSVYARDESAVIDMGIGKLTIKFDNDQIKYKFVPSKDLEESVTNAVINERNPLVDALESSLVDKMTNVYKSFF